MFLVSLIIISYCILFFFFLPLPLCCYPDLSKNTSHIQEVLITKIADHTKFYIEISPHCSDQRLPVLVYLNSSVKHFPWALFWKIPCRAALTFHFLLMNILLRENGNFTVNRMEWDKKDGWSFSVLYLKWKIAQLEASNIVWWFTWSVHKIPFFCL